MSQKVRDISVEIVVENGDEEEVLESIEKWFYGHHVGLRWGRSRPRASEPRNPTTDEAIGFMFD